MKNKNEEISFFPSSQDEKKKIIKKATKSEQLKLAIAEANYDEIDRLLKKV